MTPPLQPDAETPETIASAAPPERASPTAVVRDYVSLTKPKIISLLLITAAGGMFLAEQGLPSLTLLAWVWIGGALASGGANAINHQIDRDIDREMRRTQSRPVAGRRVAPRYALAFGIALNIAAFVIMATLIRPWTAGLLPCR